MFSWRVSTYAQQTPVDAILDKGHVILEDLLEIDDLAKEARVVNGRLMAYLKKQDTLRQLLEYLVARPPAPKTGQQSSQEQTDARTKHTLAACEVLCSLAEEVPGALAGNNDLLHLLFSATGSPTSLDCALAGYFARLVGILLTRCAEQMLAFLEATRGIVDSLLEHLDTAGMAETFVRIVGADEQAVPNLPAESLAWLSELDIIARLLARLDEDGKTGAHGNVAEVLAAIARSRSSPLTRQLCEPSNLNSLISRAVVPPPKTPSVQALNIYIALLERRRLLATVMRTSAEISAANNEADANLSKVIAAMVPHTPMLALVLSTAHSTVLLETSYGVLRPPLGSVRLTVIELVAVLLRTGSEEAEAAIIASGIVREILAVFLRFPFNSILHHQVTSIVACMLEAGSDAIVGHLFGDCDLLGWLLNAPAHCEPEPRSGDTRERTPLRAGYMGHLTEIANSLQTVAARRPPIAHLLCASTAWTDFAFGPLAERNQLEDVLSWRCGHPQMRGAVPGAAKDGDTEMPDLQLDALANLDRHAGRYSAFSDEEDEDELHSLYLDASGDSDLWDLAAAESGDAIQRHGSPSPFASRSLLGSFDMEDDRDGSWMQRPPLLADGSEGHLGDGEDLGGQSSPPATWEDRADSSFETSTSWMESDDLDEDGTVLTASPELDDGAGTPDLLADSPPDAPSPNAARVTPRVLFPARQPPVTEIAVPPATAGGSPRQAHEPEADPHSAGGGLQWSRGRQSERELSGERVQSPMGCYSTLASHHRGKGSAGGHELPACFASPPTSPPMTARSQHPVEAMDTISLADPPSATQEAAEDAQPRDVELLETEDATIDAGSGGAPAKAAGTPMAGLRDLFAPAETQSFSEEQPLDGNAASPQDVAVRSGREGSDSSPTGMMGNAPFSEQSKASDTVESDTPPFRGKHRRWAESDAVLVPRGESEEETLVGSFTKLLVSQDEDFPEGTGASTATGAQGRRGCLSMSCAQQAPKASHPSAVEREWPE
ncbi:hypothetical protein WJX75_004564 [Coccomyxa subellipsoidea]|uniref:SAPS-domain-containing protein n=1 Tax=Coccomyxa subellipsoidea TaxID=248742 RepID=A0ABR2Z0L7_9CHLO